MCSTAPILAVDGNSRRSDSVGISACTASTKLAWPSSDRSVMAPTRTPCRRSCSGIMIAVCSSTADSERRMSATTGASYPVVTSQAAGAWMP